MARDPTGDGSIALSQVVGGVVRGGWQGTHRKSHLSVSRNAFRFYSTASQMLPTFSVMAAMEGGA